MFFVVFSESVAFGTQTKYRILDERSVQGLDAEVAAVFGAENVYFCHSRKSVDVAEKKRRKKRCSRAVMVIGFGALDASSSLDR